MNTSIIQLEEIDTIPSIKNKLLHSSSQRVLMVWPNSGYILLSSIDCLIILRYAESLGLQIGMVLDDPNVIRIMKQAGISTFSSIPESQKKPWRKPTIQKNIANARKDKSNSLIQTYLDNRKVSKKSTPILVRWLFFLLGIVSFASLVVFLIPSATVTISPQRDLQKLEIPVRSDLSIKQVSIAGIVPLSSSIVEVEGVFEGISTGTIRLADKFSVGEVVFRNLSDRPISIPAGTIVRSEMEPDIRFKTKVDVVLPAGIESEKITQIESLVGGIEGNIEANNLTIVEGNFGGNVAVTNPEPTIGGVDIKTFSPTENDYEKAKEELIRMLSEKAYQELVDEHSNDFFIPRETVIFEDVINSELIPEIGYPGERFTLRMQATFSVLMVSKEDIMTYSNMVLSSDLDSNYLPIHGTLDFEIDENSVKFDEKNIEFEISASQNIIPIFDEQQIIQRIIGLQKDHAIMILNEDFSYDKEPQIDINPSFWNHLPFLPFRIDLVIDD